MKGRRFPRWLYPGMHIKRWLVVLLAGDRDPRAGRGDLHPRPVPDQRRGRDPDRLLAHRRVARAGDPRRAGGRARACADRRRHVGPHALGRVAVRRPQRQRPRGAVHEALPRARAADRGDRRRDRPLDAAARAQGLQREHHGGRCRRRRRRQQRSAAPAARDHPARRHPQLHRRPRRRRAAHDPAHAVPLPVGLGPRRPRLRQPVHRRHDRGDRRLRGGGARVEPGARGARPGAAGHQRPAQPVGAARVRQDAVRAGRHRHAPRSRSSASSSSRPTSAPTARRSSGSWRPR